MKVNALDLIKDNILNGVIKFINSVNDNDKELKGIAVIRKYQDAPRPVFSASGSDHKNYCKSVFFEVWLDELNPFSSCNENYFNEETGVYEQIVSKTYNPTISVDVIGCDAFNVASAVALAIESPRLRKILLPKYLGYQSQSSIIDLTALEETRHQEKVTFNLEFTYVMESVVALPTYKYSECCFKPECE